MTVQKVKVRVFKRPNDIYYNIESSHPLPTANMVLSCLSQRAAAVSKGWFYNTISLSEWIRGCSGSIKPVEWAEAIASATAHVLGMSAEAEAELAMVSEGGYLALGNTLFKMTPTDFITTGSRALPALRRTVIADAKVQAESLVVAATDRATRIRNDADTYRANVNRECLQVKTAHEAMRRELAINIPQWAKDNCIPIRYRRSLDDDTMTVEWGMWTAIQLDRLEWGHRSIEGDPPVTRTTKRIIRCLKVRPVPVLLWGCFPITQSAIDVANVVRAITCDKATGLLPHISEHACMVIGDAPLTFNSLADYLTLKAGIERAMSIVNMDSLLVVPETSTHSWYLELDRFMPPDLLAVISSIRSTDRQSPYWHWHPTTALNDAIDKGALAFESMATPLRGDEPATFSVSPVVVPSPEAPAVLTNDYGEPLPQPRTNTEEGEAEDDNLGPYDPNDDPDDE